MILRKNAALLALAMLTAEAHASSLTVTSAFRFIRADTYAASGGVIDQGADAVDLRDWPTDGASATGVFVSTRSSSATASSSSGSAHAAATVSVDSIFEFDDHSLTFTVAGQVGLDTSAAGDGAVRDLDPDPNCCRSFSFLNFNVEVDTTAPLKFSVFGSGSGVEYSLRDINDSNSMLNNAIGDGVLQPGSYRFGLIHTLESGDSNFSAADTFDYGFTLTPVPLPAAAWLFISALGGLVLLGRRRRVHSAAA